MNLVFALCTIVFGVAAGAGTGYGLEFTPMVSHLFFDEILCGAVAGFTAAMVANQAAELAPQERPLMWASAVAVYGAVMGLLLALLWYCWDLEGSLALVGGIAGLLSGIPAATSYGFFGGEQRMLGLPEAGNLVACLLFGGLVGMFIGLDDGDFYSGVAIGALCAMIPALLGGRVNPWEYFGD